MLLINLSDQYELNKKKVKIIYSGGKSGWPGDIFKVNLNINKILRLGYKFKELNSTIACMIGIKKIINELKNKKN